MTDDVIKPTRQRMRRAPGFDELTETQAGGVTRKSGAVRVWTQLENLYRNGGLTDEQYQAGLKYYADWYLAGFAPRVTSRMAEWVQNNNSSSGDLDAADRRVFHAKRFAEANKLLETFDMRKAIHWLVINDIPCEAIGRKAWGYRTRHKANTAGRVEAAKALQGLAKFYGLVK